MRIPGSPDSFQCIVAPATLHLSTEPVRKTSQWYGDEPLLFICAPSLYVHRLAFVEVGREGFAWGLVHVFRCSLDGPYEEFVASTCWGMGAFGQDGKPSEVPG